MKIKKPAGTPADADQSMSAALRTEYKKLRELSSSANQALGAHVEARYKFATIVRAIKSDANKYGEGAIQQLATAFRTDKSLLYKEVKVVEMWKLADLKATEGRVTWTHFIALTQVTNARERAAHVKAVIEQALSVSELERRIRRGPGAEPQEEDEEIANPASGGNRGQERFVAAISKVVAEVEHFGKREALHDKLLFEKLGKVTKSEIGADGLKSLQSLVRALRKAETLTQSRIGEVSEALARLGADTSVTTSAAAE